MRELQEKLRAHVSGLCSLEVLHDEVHVLLGDAGLVVELVFVRDLRCDLTGSVDFADQVVVVFLICSWRDAVVQKRDHIASALVDVDGGLRHTAPLICRVVIRRAEIYASRESVFVSVASQYLTICWKISPGNFLKNENQCQSRILHPA